MRKHVLLVVLFLLSIGTKAQNSACPGLKNPIAFGMYSNYSGQTGVRQSGASTYSTSYTVMTSSIINAAALATTVSPETSYNSSCRSGNNEANRFIIKNQGTDPHTTQSQLTYTPPYDPSFIRSIRLGNCYNDAEAEGLYYTLDVAPNNALLFIHYAIVLEAPGHGATGNPEFIIRVKRESQPGSGVFINTDMADTLCYIVQSPNSATNPVAPWINAGSGIVYKPWAKVAINLNKYLYSKVRVEMYVGDCQPTAHFGYCYIAGDCQPMILTSSGCAAGSGTEVTTIKAPKGLDSYRWQAQDLQGNWYDLQAIQDVRTVNDSILLVQASDFNMNTSTGNPNPSNWFRCIMTSAMDPSKPFESRVELEVNNKKPYISIDTSSLCDGTIVLSDRSVCPYEEFEDDIVDTTQSEWDFGDGSPIKIGGTVSHRYATAGDYQITLRTTAANGECYTEGGRPVRVRKAPLIELVTSDTNICENDKLSIRVLTNGVLLYDYSWIIKDEDGNFIEVADEGEIYDPEGNYLYRYTFQDTTIVEFRARNAEGCDTTISININAEEFPELVIQGDTVICNGTQSIVNVTSNMPNCTYEWYLDTSLTTPNYTGSQMVRTPTEDEIYYVKVTTPNGCVSWDSLRIRLMIPELSSDKVKICAYDTVQLIGNNAVTYEWTANPADPSLEGQEGNDTIYVTPLVSTTYKMVGLGSNGCRANPLYKNITVYPYPVPQVEYDPTFVDSEDPFITFNNLTLGATYTEWDFHDGKKMNGATVTYEFKDLTIDSAYVTMTTSNEMGCTSDTTIAMPISIFAVWVPNAFTPDKSTNNKFRTYTGNDIRDYSLYVYDREGRQVFYTDDKEGAWDGTFNGKKCKQGVYVWVASYRRLETDKVLQQKGTVTLIR